MPLKKRQVILLAMVDRMEVECQEMKEKMKEGRINNNRSELMKDTKY